MSVVVVDVVVVAIDDVVVAVAVVCTCFGNGVVRMHGETRRVARRMHMKAHVHVVVVQASLSSRLAVYAPRARGCLRPSACSASRCIYDEPDDEHVVRTRAPTATQRN